MEHLNKTQLILLCIVVSFVSSIATTILTVALLEQAPGGLTESVYKAVTEE